MNYTNCDRVCKNETCNGEGFCPEGRAFDCFLESEEKNGCYYFHGNLNISKKLK